MSKYYYRARYYDPKVGGFISEDPLFLASTDLNQYRYVENAPIIFIDPYGEFKAGQFFTGAIMAIAGGGLVTIAVTNPVYNAVTKGTGIFTGIAIGAIGIGLMIKSFDDPEPIIDPKISCNM